METTTPPPSELPFGARVHAAFTKYDGSPHWEYDLVVLGVDSYGVWVGGAPGGYIARPGREFTSDAYWLNLYPHTGAWVATINDTGGTFSSRIYVDVTTPARWWHRPDGSLRVDCIDLDLDVIKSFSGEVFIDDEDEFADHQVLFDYPADVVHSAERTTEWLFHHIRRLDEPFDEVAEHWMAVCRASVASDERGRAVLVPGAQAPSGLGGPQWEGGRPYGMLPRAGAMTADRHLSDSGDDVDRPRPGDDGEDFLAVWSDVASSAPLVDTQEDAEPVVQVDHGSDTPSVPEGVAADFEDIDDIDTTPVDPAEVTGILLTTDTRYESPVWFDGRPVDPEDIGVTAELADRLRDWSDRWRRDFDPDRGWHPQARIGDYEALGEWLGRRVKDAAPDSAVWVQPAHLGRSGLHEIVDSAHRVPTDIALDPVPGAELPVSGDFVTLDGRVGCFSAETNARLLDWAEAGAPAGPEVDELLRLMAVELGPDYRVVV